MNHPSVRDLELINVATFCGREELRALLEEKFIIDPLVVDWVLQVKVEAKKDYEAMRAFQRKFIEADHQLRFAKVLLERAADALVNEGNVWFNEGDDLVAELRKAAQ